MPNPSFEDYSACPCSDSYIHYAIPWEGMNTADFFHACANQNTCIVSVPENWMGYQIPLAGNGYAGCAVYGESFANNPEYISVPLSVELITGAMYYLSFHVNLSDFSNVAMKPIGAVVSPNRLVDLPLDNLFDFETQVESSEIIYDTLGWTKVDGCFVAAGGEKYLTIGNFSDASSMDTVRLHDSSLPDRSFYFIDDVSLSEIADCPIIIDSNSTELVSLPNVFTPNGDGQNDFFGTNHQDSITGELSIYNRWGRQIFFSQGTNLIWDGNGCNEGIYYYVLKLHSSSHTEFERKGFVHLLR